MSVAIITYLCVPGNVFHLEEQLILMEYWTSNQKKKKKLLKSLMLLMYFIMGPFETWLLNIGINSASNRWRIRFSTIQSKSITVDGKYSVWPALISGLEF